MGTFYYCHISVTENLTSRLNACSDLLVGDMFSFPTNTNCLKKSLLVEHTKLREGPHYFPCSEENLTEDPQM